MKKSKVENTISLPSIPSLDDIKSDLSNSKNNDVVFSDYFLQEREKKNANEFSNDVYEVYNEASTLLNIMTRLKSEQGTLKQKCEKLKISKEEVSSITLQLRGRLENHKTSKA